jgi:hypothetical protein
MEVLAAMTLPQVLNIACSVLKVAWNQYQTIKDHKAQCRALLQKCTDLVVAVAKQANLKSNDPMLVHVEDLNK